MRMFYELAGSETIRGQVATRAEINPLARALNESLKQHPLPPFSAIANILHRADPC